MRLIKAVLLSSIAFSLSFAQQGNQPVAAPAATKTEAAKSQTAAPSNSLGLTMGRAVFAKGLDENGPIEPGTAFTLDAKKLYCITQIKGAKDTVRIEHRWFVNEKPVFTLPLPIKSVNWRTQSYITLRPEFVGNVTVVVVLLPKEEILTTMTCEVK